MTERSQVENWVEAAAQGDQLAVSKLLAMHHPLLRARAVAKINRTMKAKIEAEDILQQVYVQVIRQIDRFENRGPRSFLNWVYTILDNKIIDARRSMARKARNVAREATLATGSLTDSYADLLDQVFADTTTPSRVARRDEAVGALMACLSTLSSQHRELIQLRFLDGLPVAAVAARLDKTDAAVVALSKRALDALRAAMERLGDFTHGA
jgi:RNA polymerase sigma-70 factor (ECF subfamily)